MVLPQDRAPVDDAPYESLLADLEEGVIFQDRANRVVMSNPAASQILGWSAESLSGRSPLEPGWPVTNEDGTPLPDDERPAVVALRTAKPQPPRVLRVVRSDSSYTWVSVTARPVFEDDLPFPSGVVVSFVDITLRRQSEEWRQAAESALREREREAERLRAQHERSLLMARLAEAERLESLGRLARGVAHDFRNLLGVILNYATVASKQVDPTAVGADLERIRVAGERGVEVVNQLLAFSTRPASSAETFDLRDAVDLVVGLVEGPFAPATIGWARPDGPCAVAADRVQVEQAVLNLMLNARDALLDPGCITVEVGRAADPASPTGSSVTLSVHDDGVGMPTDVQARAFEPGFTTKEDGSGVGLATVGQTVGAAGGRVALESGADCGTTVRVTLPAAG